MARRRLDPQARRAAILNAAIEAFDEADPDHVNVEAVAERAGVSRALVYTYFSNRQGLFRAVFHELLGEVGASLAGALEGAATSEERFGRWITTLAGYARSHPNRWQVIRWNVLTPDPELGDGLPDLLHQVVPEGSQVDPLALTALLGMVDWTAERLDEEATWRLAAFAWSGASSLSRPKPE